MYMGHFYINMEIIGLRNKCEWDRDYEYYPENQSKQKYEVERKQFLGTKAEGLMQRTVAYCLRCKKAECDGCPTRAERTRMKGEKCNGFD